MKKAHIDIAAIKNCAEIETAAYLRKMAEDALRGAMALYIDQHGVALTRNRILRAAAELEEFDNGR
jgi:hypothetical protein